MIYRGPNQPSKPAMVLICIVAVIYTLAVNLCGFIAFTAIVDMLIIPELFIDPVFILWTAGSIFVLGNILATCMYMPLMRFLEGEPMFFKPTSGTSPSGMPKWFQDFGWFAEEHPEIDDGEDND